MNRQTRLTSTQVYRLKVGDRPWIRDRYEVVPRHIGRVVKVTDTQVHVELDYGLNGGIRSTVHKFHRLGRSYHVSSGYQLDGTKSQSIYGLATNDELRTYLATIDTKVREREQYQVAKEKRESHENRVNADLPINMNVNKLESGKWNVSITDVSIATVQALKEALES